MESAGEGRYRATVSHDDILGRFDFQYYFEVLLPGGGGRLWPAWEEGQPYFVVRTVEK